MQSRNRCALPQQFVLATVFGGWMAFSVLANVYSKSALLAAAHFDDSSGALLLSFSQLAVGAFCGTVYTFVSDSEQTEANSKVAPSAPQTSHRRTKSALFTLAALHALGVYATNYGMQHLSAAFAHVVKATEPMTTVALAAVVLQERASAFMLASLCMMMAGLAVASWTAIDFTVLGLVVALLSNVAFSARNVYTKRFMHGTHDQPPSGDVASAESTGPKSEPVLRAVPSSASPLQLYFSLCNLGTCLLVPVLLLDYVYHLHIPTASTYVDRTKYLSEDVFARTPSHHALVLQMAASGLFHCLYNLCSFFILHQVSAVTHSLGNVFKRIVVWVALVIYFGTPTSAVHAVGILVTLCGLALHSRAKYMHNRALSPSSTSHGQAYSVDASMPPQALGVLVHSTDAGSTLSMRSSPRVGVSTTDDSRADRLRPNVAVSSPASSLNADGKKALLASLSPQAQRRVQGITLYTELPSLCYLT